MRRVFIIFLIFIFLAGNVYDGYGRWIDNWFDQYMSSGPDYYSSQKRGYLSFGTFSGRFSNTSPGYLFSIERPRFRAGCGGIDIFLGSFGFTGVEYLVQKLQRLIQAAPAVAFHLALQVLSSSLDGVVSKVMSVIDFLNQLQLDECKLLHPIFSVDASKIGGSDFPQRLQNIADEVIKGYKNLFEEAWNKYKEKKITSAEVKKVVEDTCPSYVKDIVMRGSLIEYIGNQMNLDDDLIKAVRYITGDIVFYQDQGGSFVKEYKEGQFFSKDTNTFEISKVYLMDRNGRVSEKQIDLTDKIRRELMSAYEAKRQRTQIGRSYENVAKFSPIPLEYFVNAAVITKDSSLIMAISPVVAQGVFYRMLEDIISKANEIISKVPKVGAPECALLSEVNTYLDKMKENAYRAGIILFNKYQEYLKEASITLDVALKIMQYNDMLKAKLAEKFTTSTVNYLLGGS